MPKERIGADIKARAESLIDAASVVTIAHVSLVHRAALLEAVAVDLDAAAHRAAGDGERLDKLETRTRADTLMVLAHQRYQAEAARNAATAEIRVAWVAGRDRDRRISATTHQPERRCR